MPSSNILLFDANKANMMADEQYSTNTQRLNGVQSGIASSQLQNKTLYQVSLVAYAIAQIMNQNGLDANDTAAVSAFVANLSGTMLQKVADLATTQEAQAGVATGKWMSPALVKAAIDTLAAKAQNILSDETKMVCGLGTDATPNDAFLALALGVGKYGFIVKVLFPDGSPVQNATLTGISGLNGESAVTNADGVAIGVSESNSANIGVTSPYIDFGNAAGTLIQSTRILTSVEITLNPIVAEISTSKEIVFSPVAKTADFCGIGGGSGAKRFDEGPTGNGGAGGYIQNLLNFVLSENNRSMSVIIGSGGPVGSNGGTTSVTANGSQILSARGGNISTSEDSAAVGNGDGGLGKDLYRDATSAMVAAANGSPATGYKFNDPELGIPGSGGGGGCLYVNSNSPITVSALPSGGSPNGGLGGYVDDSGNHNGTAGTYPGGGGGTGPYTAYSGANGCLFVRAHYSWEV